MDLGSLNSPQHKAVTHGKGALMVLAGGSDFLLLQVGLGPIFGVYGPGFTAGIVASTYAASVRKNRSDILPVKIV